MSVKLARQILEIEEGWRDTPYRDTEGYPTVGYGFKIAGKDAPLPEFKLPKAAGEVWLDSLLSELETELWPVIKGHTPQRRAILLSMAYQMGTSGLLKFKKTLEAGNRADWKEMSEGMLDSRWARQTPARAKRHAEVILTGKIRPTYKIEV